MNTNESRGIFAGYVNKSTDSGNEINVWGGEELTKQILDDHSTDFKVTEFNPYVAKIVFTISKIWDAIKAKLGKADNASSVDMLLDKLAELIGENNG